MNYPKSARVRTREEYLEFFKGSEVKKLGCCIIFRIQNKLTKARLGITIKSRTTSIFRNQMKRQIREVFRLNYARLGAFDYNIVIPSQVKVDHKTAKKIRTSLEKVWSNEVVF